MRGSHSGRPSASHAPKLHALITANLEEGHLLPRTLGELDVHAERFTIALRGKPERSSAAPSSRRSARTSPKCDRSPSTRGARGGGVGTLIVDELRRRARREGFEKLCAFTHAPGYFIHMGFSIVPHLWLPEKVFTDCVKCPHFRQCGQYAMVVPLARTRPFDAVHDRPAAARYA